MRTTIELTSSAAVAIGSAAALLLLPHAVIVAGAGAGLYAAGSLATLYFGFTLGKEYSSSETIKADALSEVNNSNKKEQKVLSEQKQTSIKDACTKHLLTKKTEESHNSVENAKQDGHHLNVENLTPLTFASPAPPTGPDDSIDSTASRNSFFDEAASNYPTPDSNERVTVRRRPPAPSGM